MVRKVYKSVVAALLVISMLGNTPLVVAQQITNNVNPSSASTNTTDKEEVVENNIYQGEVKIDISPDSNIFTGETKKLDSGTKLELTVATVIGSDVSVEGDEFFAEVTSDLMVDGGVVIPLGTVCHGKVTESENEKRLGRDGYVTMEFDYILTPDGREIPVKAKMSTKSHPLKSFAKVALTDVGYTLVGGAIGGILAVKLGGLGMAIASHGYTVAGGAAIGGTVGLAQSLIRKGKPRFIQPGDQIKIKLTENMELPVLKNSAIADEEHDLKGLTVDIFDCKFENDPFGTPNTINLGIEIVNKTDRSFSFFDVALTNEYGNTFYPSPFADTDMWFQQISPGSKLNGYLAFSVDNPRQSHWLVFYDKYTRTQLAKVSVTNAIRKLRSEKGKKKIKKASQF